MKAGLSLARPTQTTGTALLQKTVPHGARYPRTEPARYIRTAYAPLRKKTAGAPIQRPFRKKQATRSGLYTRSFGQTARRRRLRRRSDGTGSGFWPLFCTVSYSLPIRPKRPRSAARVTRRTGSRNADKIQAIPEHTTARFRKSDVSSAHPLFGFRTDLRGGLFVFAPDAAFAASPDGPVGKPDGEGPAPPSYLRHRQGTRSVPPQQGHGKTGACPAADTAASAGPVSRFRIFPSRHARNVFRPAARRGAPHAGSLHLAGRLFRYRPFSPGPPRSSTKRYGKKRRRMPDPGRRKSHGQPTHRTGPRAHRSRCFPARRGLIFRKKS